MDNTQQNQNEEEQSVIVPIQIETNINEITKKYYFLEDIKIEKNQSHYIVEDEDPQYELIVEEDTILYLNQRKFNSLQTYQFFTNYYERLYQYCNSPFVNKNIILTRSIFEYKNEKTKNYELIITQEYGEADRIDMSKIQKEQIIEYLKNFCYVLEDIKKLYNLYHGNIRMKNILLVNQDLKFGGFQPCQGKQNSWREQLVQVYGYYRFDMFMLGLLWLELIGVELDFLSNEMSLEKIKSEIQLYFDILEDTFILNKLLDLDKYPKYHVENVIFDFEEQFIIKIEKTEEINDLYLDFKGSIYEDQDDNFTLKQNIFKNSLSDDDSGSLQKMNTLQSQNQKFFKMENLTFQEMKSVISDNQKKSDIDFEINEMKKFFGFKEIRKGIQKSNSEENKQTGLKHSASCKNIQSQVVNFYSGIRKQSQSNLVYINFDEISKFDQQLSKTKNIQEVIINEENFIQQYLQKIYDNFIEKQFQKIIEEQQFNQQVVQNEIQNDGANVILKKLSVIKQDSLKDDILNQTQQNQQKTIVKDEVIIQLNSSFDDESILSYSQNEKNSQKTEKNSKIQKKSSLSDIQIKNIKKIYNFSPTKNNVNKFKKNSAIKLNNPPIRISRNSVRTIPDKKQSLTLNTTIQSAKKDNNQSKRNLQRKSINFVQSKKNSFSKKNSQTIEFEQNQQKQRKLKKIKNQIEKGISHKQKNKFFYYNKSHYNKQQSYNIILKKHIYSINQDTKKQQEKKISFKKNFSSSDQIDLNFQEEFKLFNNEQYTFYPTKLLNIQPQLLKEFIFDNIILVIDQNIQQYHDSIQNQLIEQSNEVSRSKNSIQQIQFQLFEEEINHEQNFLKEIIKNLSNKNSFQNVEEQMIKAFQQQQISIKIDCLKILAYLNFIQLDINQSIKLLQKAIDFINEEKNQNFDIKDFYLQIAYFYQINKEPQQALKILDKEIFLEENSRTFQYHILKAECYSMLKMFDKSQSQYSLINEYYFQSQMNKRIFYNLCQSIYQLLLLDNNKIPYEAIDNYNQCKKKFVLNQKKFPFEKVSVIKFQIEILNLINNENSTLVNYILNDCLKNDLQKIGMKYKKKLALILTKFSENIKNVKNFQNLQNFYEIFLKKALEIYTELFPQTYLLQESLNIINNLGLLYQQQKKFYTSQYYFNRAIKIYKSIYKQPGIL